MLSKEIITPVLIISRAGKSRTPLATPKNIMTCCSSISNESVIMATVVMVFVFGMLTTTALASALSFSQICNIRADLIVLQHNILASLWLLIAALHNCATSIQQESLDFTRIVEQIRHVARWPVTVIGTITAFLPFLSLALQIAISVQPDQSCNQESGNFAIVWFYIDTGLFVMLSLAFVYAVVEIHINSRDLKRILKKSRSLHYQLVKMYGTNEGWDYFCRDFADFFMNLQDSQKESLLPVLLLYAIDELTWELREIPVVLQGTKCSICEEGFNKWSQIVTCLTKPDLVHRDCLMRQIAAQELSQNNFLGNEFRRNDILVPLLRLAVTRFKATAPQVSPSEVVSLEKRTSRGKIHPIGGVKPQLRLFGQTVLEFYHFLDEHT